MCFPSSGNDGVQKRPHSARQCINIFQVQRSIFCVNTRTLTHTRHYQKLFASTAFWFTLNKKGESFCCLFIYCWQSRPFSLSPSVADSVHVRVFAPFSVNIFLSIQVEILCVKCMLIGLNYKVIATNPFIPRISFNVGCVGSIQHHLTHRSHSHRVIYFKWYKALPSH